MVLEKLKFKPILFARVGMCGAVLLAFTGLGCGKAKLRFSGDSCQSTQFSYSVPNVNVLGTINNTAPPPFIEDGYAYHYNVTVSGSVSGLSVSNGCPSFDAIEYNDTLYVTISDEFDRSHYSIVAQAVNGNVTLLLNGAYMHDGRWTVTVADSSAQPVATAYIDIPPETPPSDDPPSDE